MPFPNNCPRAQDLPDLPPQEIAALPAAVLATLQRETESAVKLARAAKCRLDAALVLKYGARATEARGAAGKDTGTVRFTDDDITVVADLPKRVDWDQAKLGEMVERIRAAGDDPAEYVEISFKVAERNYGAWLTAIREGFEPARTVRPGQLSIQLMASGVGE
jgi:hypothetical protein